MHSDSRQRPPGDWLAFALVALSLAMGCTTGPGVLVTEAWIRPVGIGHTTAGYFTLVNNTADTLVLVGADASAAEATQMHETVHIEGRVMMREAERFVVPPHQRLRFEPGGNHLMLLHAANALAAGDTTGIVLRFADGRKLHATARVRS